MTRRKRAKMLDRLKYAYDNASAETVMRIIDPVKVRSLKKLRKIILENAQICSGQVASGDVELWGIDWIDLGELETRFALPFQDDAARPPDSDIWDWKTCLAYDGRLALIVGDNLDDLGIVKYEDLY